MNISDSASRTLFAFLLTLLLGCQTPGIKTVAIVDPDTNEPMQIMEIDYAEYRTMGRKMGIKWVGEVTESPYSAFENYAYERDTSYIPHGKGILTYSDGDYFDGLVHYGVPVVGTEYRKDGKPIFIGTFLPKTAWRSSYRFYDIGYYPGNYFVDNYHGEYNHHKGSFDFIHTPGFTQNGYVYPSTTKINTVFDGRNRIQINFRRDSGGHYKKPKSHVSMRYYWGLKPRGDNKYVRKYIEEPSNYRFEYNITRYFVDTDFNTLLEEIHRIYDKDSGKSWASSREKIIHHAFFVFDETLFPKIGIKKINQSDQGIFMGVLVNPILATAKSSDLNHSYFYPTGISPIIESRRGEKVNKLVQFLPHIKITDGQVQEVGYPRSEDQDAWIGMPEYMLNGQTYYFKGPVDGNGLPNGWGVENGWHLKPNGNYYYTEGLRYYLNSKEKFPVYYENGMFVGESSLFLARDEIDEANENYHFQLGVKRLQRRKSNLARIAELEGQYNAKRAKAREKNWQGYSDQLRDRLNNNVLTTTINKNTAQASQRVRESQTNDRYSSSSSTAQSNTTAASTVYSGPQSRDELRRRQESMRKQWQAQQSESIKLSSTGNTAPASSAKDKPSPSNDSRVFGMIICEGAIHAKNARWNGLVYTDPFELPKSSQTSDQYIISNFEKTTEWRHVYSTFGNCRVKRASLGEILEVPKSLGPNKNFIGWMRVVRPDSFNKASTGGSIGVE